MSDVYFKYLWHWGDFDLSKAILCASADFGQYQNVLLSLASDHGSCVDV